MYIYGEFWHYAVAVVIVVTAAAAYCYAGQEN